MTGLPNICGPAAVAEYERQCSNDFIFSQPASTGHTRYLTPKDENSGATPTSAATSPGSAASSPCVSEIVAPTADALPTAGTATVGALPDGPPAPSGSTVDPRAPHANGGARGDRIPHTAAVSDVLAAMAEDLAS